MHDIRLTGNHHQLEEENMSIMHILSPSPFILSKLPCVADQTLS